MKYLYLSIMLLSIGSSAGYAQSDPSKAPTEQDGKVVTGETVPLRILAKPQAAYNDAARSEGVEGSVRLKVTLLASGQVGSITPVTVLPHGLTEQAIAAARQIKFEPATVKGVPVSKVVTIEYSFSIYWDENDKEIKEKARILEMPPTPAITDSGLDAVGGKIQVTVFLRSDGSADLVSVSPALSSESEKAIRQAVWKIKFEPAETFDGKKVSIHRTLEIQIR